MATASAAEPLALSLGGSVVLAFFSAGGAASADGAVADAVNISSRGGRPTGKVMRYGGGEERAEPVLNSTEEPARVPSSSGRDGTEEEREKKRAMRNVSQRTHAHAHTHTHTTCARAHTHTHIHIHTHTRPVFGAGGEPTREGIHRVLSVEKSVAEI